MMPRHAVLAASLLLAGCALDPQPTTNPGLVARDPAPAPAPDATADPAIEAVLLALDDERKARAFYLAVLARHGDVRPFVNIAPAEQRHAGHLIAILEARGVPVPPDLHDPGAIEVPDTRQACCELAAQSERDNVALYDDLAGIGAALLGWIQGVMGNL